MNTKKVDWDRANQLRNNLNIDIKELENSKNNPRKFWKQINELLPNSKNSVIQELHDENTAETFNGEQLNDHINEYFANIGPRLAADCTPGLTDVHVTHGIVD